MDIMVSDENGVKSCFAEERMRDSHKWESRDYPFTTSKMAARCVPVMIAFQKGAFVGSLNW